MTVYLVGAGPGRPRAADRARARADRRGRRDPLRPADPAGRRSTARATPSSSTSASRAAGRRCRRRRSTGCWSSTGPAGGRVVRLKGGDPFVFGRGGEEALVLRAAGIPFEVVPGITAGIAAPAYAGIPVTHRELAQRRRVRHRPRGGQAETLDWAALAAFPGTLVFYMGVQGAAADRRAARRGRAPGVASRSRSSSAGRCPGQRTVVVDAGRRSARPPRASARPAITLVGDGRRRCASRSPGSSRGRCTAAPSRSPARARRPARWPRGCAASAPTVVEAPAIRTQRARRSSCPTSRLRPAVRHLAERRRPSSSATCATRASWPA